MHGAVQIVNRRHTVVDGVRRRQTARFRAYTAHVNRCFNGFFQRRRYRFRRHRVHGLRREIANRLITHFRNAQTRQARLHQHQVDTVRRITCSGFKISCQAIAHARGKKARRLGRQQFRIRQNRIRIIRQEQIAVERTVRVINHRQSRARRVCRCQRRHNHHRHFLVIRHRFRRIQRFAAADADHIFAGMLCKQGLVFVDFIVRTFTAEHAEHRLNTAFFKAACTVLPRLLLDERVGNNQGLFAVLFDMLAQIRQQAGLDQKFHG